MQTLLILSTTNLSDTLFSLTEKERRERGESKCNTGFFFRVFVDSVKVCVNDTEEMKASPFYRKTKTKTQLKVGPFCYRLDTQRKNRENTLFGENGIHTWWEKEALMTTTTPPTHPPTELTQNPWHFFLIFFAVLEKLVKIIETLYSSLNF